MLSIAIHANPAMPHQMEFANYLHAGFDKHGLRAQVTTAINREADIHVVLGPHYAKKHWLGHPRVLLLDRGWWGDGAFDVALAWMDSDGALKINTGCDDDRPRPALKPWKVAAQNALYCLDFGAHPDPVVMETFGSMRITQRYHPAVAAPPESLDAAFERHDVAIGFSTGTLVKACIAGLAVFCYDERNPVYPMASRGLNQINRPDRAGWLKNLSYHQWNGDEIAAGHAWAFLKDRM